MDEQGGKSQSGPQQSGSDEHPQLGGHHHERFPTPEEFRTLFGEEVLTVVDAELAVMANERHLDRIARHQTGALSGALGSIRDISTNVTFPAPLGTVPLESAPLTMGHPVLGIATLGALRTPRVNHKFLGQTERDRFNRALERAHQAGTYQPLADIHANRRHRMHTMHSGAVGTQRFLPWHRLYLLLCENLLSTYEPSVRIPYWDYANDHERPDWVWRPPNVTRGIPGGSGGSLPTRQTIDDILRNPTYTGFTAALESDGHNGVHNWCNGTISNPDTAPQDPIFWLLHANIDYIWNTWQATHNGVPLLSGPNAVLDPWQPTTATEVDSVINLGYWYKSTLQSIFGQSIVDTLPSP